MKLLPELDSLEGVPEDIHENYEQGEDGKFRLVGFVPADKVEDVSGLKSALQKERANAKSAAQQLKEFQEKYGDLDPEEIKAMKEERERLEEEKAKSKGDWDQRKKQIQEAHLKELSKKDEDIVKLKKTVEKYLVDGQAAQAIAAASGSDLLLPFVKERAQVVQTDDGEYAVRVVDEHGNHKVNGKGDYMGINELVSEMRDQERFAALFKAPVQNGGSGTPPNDGQGTGKPPGKGGGSIPKDVKRSTLTTASKVAYIREYGKEAYDNLPFE